MPISHTVRQGESLVSLGRRYGICPQKILDHAGNRSLAERKRTEGILNPGDEVVIPDLEFKEEPCASDSRHRFRCHIALTWLKLQFKRDDQPRANVPYLLETAGCSFAGELDDKGRLQVRIPAHAQVATLFLGAARDEQLRLRIGRIDPVDEISGIRQRLASLGFAGAGRGSDPDERLRACVRAFQSKYELPVTGEPDQALRDKLVEVYGG